MSIITSALITSLQTGFKQSYQDAFNAKTPDDYLSIATVVASTTKSNTYGWLGQWPGFREWAGERTLNDLKAHGYQIKNKKFESTVAVSRTDIEDDEVGIYLPMMQEMGRAAKTFPNELVFPMLASGFSTNCYDSQFFFDTDHPVYPKSDGSGTATTVSNVSAGSKKAWYLIDDSRAIKPIIFQQRKKPVFTTMNKIDDEAVFTRDEYRYGVDMRCNAGFGLWQLAHGAKTDLNAVNFNAVFDKMSALKADGGRPLGIIPTVLVVGTSNRVAAEIIVKARELVGGGSNTDYQRVKLVVSPWI